jgi:hypothetical protein
MLSAERAAPTGLFMFYSLPTPFGSHTLAFGVG